MYATRNANSCPAGTARIDTEAECQIAASVLQLTYEGPYSDRGSPKGCFRYTGTTARGIYFNPDATGDGEPDSQPLCTTSTAPPTNLGGPSLPPSPSPSMPGAPVVFLLALALLFRMQTPLAPALARSCRMWLRACACMAVDGMNSTESPHTKLCRRGELDRGRLVAVELHGQLRRRDVPARSGCGRFALAHVILALRRCGALQTRANGRAAAAATCRDSALRATTSTAARWGLSSAGRCPRRSAALRAGRRSRACAPASRPATLAPAAALPRL